VFNLAGNISVNFSYFPFPKVVIYGVTLPRGGALPANFDLTKGRTLVRVSYDPTNGWRAQHAQDEHGAIRLVNDTVAVVPNTWGEIDVVAVSNGGSVATTLGPNQDPAWRYTLGTSLGGIVISNVAVIKFLIDKFPQGSAFVAEFGYMVVAVGANREVFYKIGNAVGELTWYPSNNDWESIGGQVIGDPVVVAYEGVRRVFVFAVGTDENIYWKYYERPDHYVGGTKTGTWYPSQRGWNLLS
jgi:hypothetical protein